MEYPGTFAPLFPPPVTRAASFSECGRYRWTLTREWGEGGTVCWVMLNPSTADAEVDDPTVREVVRFSRAWGYGRAVVVNLYPFRSSSPAECRRWAEWAPCSILNHNIQTVCRQARRPDLVILAWGAAPWAAEWANEVVKDIPPGKFHCLGTNADGSPQHPLARGHHRVPRDQRPVLYSAGAQE